MGHALETVERWWKAIETGDYAAIESLTAPDCDITMPGMGRVDRDTLRTAVLPAYKAGFPDLRHEIVDAVEQGDRVAVRLRITMTQTGTFATPQAEVPPTGRTVVLESADVVTVADGRITGWHTYFDQMSMLGQLGLLPAPAGA